MAKPIQLTPPLPHADYLALVERLKREENLPLPEKTQRLLAEVRRNSLIKNGR